MTQNRVIHARKYLVFEVLVMFNESGLVTFESDELYAHCLRIYFKDPDTHLYVAFLSTLILGVHIELNLVFVLAKFGWLDSLFSQALS